MLSYETKSESTLRYNEARKRLRRALDTEWQVIRERMLNQLDTTITDEFLTADANGELLAVDDELLRKIAREALGETPLLEPYVQS